MSNLAKLLNGATLVKAQHVKGYMRDGRWVSDYDKQGSLRMEFPDVKRAVIGPVDPVPAPAPAAEKPPGWFQAKYGSGAKQVSKWPSGPQKVIGAQYGGSKPATYGGGAGHGSLFAAPKPKPKGYHPQVGEKGEQVGIYHPSTPTGPEAWAHGDQVVVVVPGGEVPTQLNGVPFSAWQAPQTDADWEDVEGQADIDEPDFHCPSHLEPAAGVLIEEPDGRCWIVAPTNGFGGAPYVCPKGRTDDMPLQATAIKEAFEEIGLHAEITGMLGDFARTQTYTRIYRARRIGGTPSAMGWESQAALLVPREKLHDYLTGGANAGILAAAQAAMPLD